MTSYCDIGDKPKVFVTFNSGTKQIYEPNFSPVEVIVEDFTEHTSHYLPEGYQLSCYSTNNERGYVFAVRDYKVVDLGSNFEFRFRFQLWAQYCESSSLTLVFNVDPGSIVIDNSITCVSVESNKQKAIVRIRQVGASTDVFTLTGDAPVKVEVACGDCPEGYCRCVIPGYPGYCCLDCHATAEQIREITNNLRSKNG